MLTIWKILCLSILSLNLYAQELAKEFVFKDYNEAKSSNIFIKFASESTKLGFITTSFDGYAKKFSYEYQYNKNTISSAVVKIIASSIDTDSDSRNEKMYELCLEANKYKEITIKIDEAIDMNKASQKVQGLLIVRDESFIVNLDLEIKKGEDKNILLGKSKFKLTDLKIKDPSIAVASVRDQFDVEFAIEL